MEALSHLWRYVAKCFLEWEILLSELQRKSKLILCSITFFRKFHYLWDNVENMVKAEGPQMTSQYGAYALHAG